MKQNLKIFALMGLVLSLGLFAASCSPATPSATSAAPVTASSTIGVPSPRRRN